MDTSAIRPDATELPTSVIGAMDGISAPGVPALVGKVAALPGRIDVPAAVAGLRHIDASTEPALVFSHLAALCVPKVCDGMIIDLVEGDHSYRIRRPAGEADVPRPLRTPVDRPTTRDAAPILGLHSVTATIDSAESPSVGPSFYGTVVCSWRDGYVPVAADASLIGLMVDHAVALIQRERLTGACTELQGRAGDLQARLNRDQRIASAVGVVMALHHVDRNRAMDLLTRISGRTGRRLDDVATLVIDSGTLPSIPADSSS